MKTKTNIGNDDEIDTKKCRLFAFELTMAERIYIKYNLDISESLRSLVGEAKDNKFTITEFLKHFNIKQSQYAKFVLGDYEYDLRIISKLESAHELLALRKALNLMKTKITNPILVA